jgi:hypothetical protein
LYTFLDALGEKEDVMIVPPDFTRFHSQSGKITRMIAEYYNFIKKTHNSSNDDDKDALSNVEKQEENVSPKMEFIPALGTHAPMTKEQIKIMFGDELAAKDPSPFLVHDWRNDVVTIGHAPSEMVSKETEFRGLTSLVCGSASHVSCSTPSYVPCINHSTTGKPGHTWNGE